LKLVAFSIGLENEISGCSNFVTCVSIQAFVQTASFNKPLTEKATL